MMRAPAATPVMTKATVNLRERLMFVRPNSMFGPKSPAERAGPRDSVLSWANYEPVGGYCQNVYFGQNAQQMEPLGWVAGWWSSPRRCALARQGVEGKRLRLRFAQFARRW